MSLSLNQAWLRAALLAASLTSPGIAYPAPTAVPTITIDNFTFSPQVLTVAPGTKVTWTNRDDIPHVVADATHPEAMRSPPLDTGDSFGFTFTRSGTYRYFCVLHPMMTGTVVVK
jgi:plastocyanin